MRRIIGLAAALLIGMAASAPGARALETFASPEAAAEALVAAARAPAGSGAFVVIFGEDGAELLSSGDDDADRRAVADFLDLAADGREVRDGEDGGKVLLFGKDGWRFPIPLRQEEDGWTFDVEAGRQDIEDMAIGRNELAAIGACADFVAAQNEYFGTLHDDEPVQQYARRLVSTEGRHDGLYWPPADAADRSPLGDRIVAAAVASPDDAGPRAYHGYRFKILTRQGPSAPGGAYDYMVGGRLLAGFAMLAWPAEYGTSGIMSFLCDQRGTVYERNLGPETETVAPAIRIFNPWSAWTAVEP